MIKMIWSTQAQVHFDLLIPTVIYGGSIGFLLNIKLITPWASLKNKFLLNWRIILLLLIILNILNVEHSRNFTTYSCSIPSHNSIFFLSKLLLLKTQKGGQP